MTADQGRDLELLLDKIHQNTNADFREYKKTSLKRRIGTRLQATKANSYGDYMAVLDADPTEYDRLLRSLTVKVTEFFRDAEAFKVLEEIVLPELISRQGDKETRGQGDSHRVSPSPPLPLSPSPHLRIWSAGCASGEEPYSVAILLAEKLGPRLADFDISIYGTDVDAETITRARRAEYEPARVAGVKKEWLDRYFDKNGKYKVKGEIRRLVKFGLLNLVSDPPISRLDLLLCRNVIIYFSRELQDRLFMRFHRALNQGGFLVLGKAEVPTGPAQALFRQVDREWRVYRKV